MSWSVYVTREGEEITVEMNGTIEVSGDIFNSIKSKGITLTFDRGEGVL